MGFFDKKSGGSLKHGLGVALALTLSAMVVQPVAAQQSPLIIARDMDIPSLDPQRALCDTCMIYNGAVYETLVALDRNNKPIPLLASKWDVSPDQTEFTFTIDPEAKFSDGSPVESKDVKWSWERLRNLKGIASFLMDSVDTIETPDPKTVVVKTKWANSEFVGVTASSFMNVANSDAASAAGAKSDETAPTADTAETWFLTNSAGSGAYVLDSYEPNVELRLKRNENYWRKAPAFDKVVMRQVKDAVSQAQMLMNGTVDIAMQIDPDTSTMLEGQNVTVDTAPSYNFVYLALSPRAKANKVPLTHDVREAISLAIDRKGILELTLGGQGRLISAPIPLGFPGADGFPEPEYNVEKAKEILAKAGLADGFELEAAFPAQNIYGVNLSLMMQKVQQDLAKVGIKVNLEPMEFANWRQRVDGDGTPLTTVYYAPDFYGSSQYLGYFALMPGTAWTRRSGEAVNPRIDELFKKALASSSDEAEKYWHEAGQEMIDDLIILPMVSPNFILAYNPQIEGVNYATSTILNLSDLSRKP